MDVLMMKSFEVVVVMKSYHLTLNDISSYSDIYYQYGDPGDYDDGDDPVNDDGDVVPTDDL